MFGSYEKEKRRFPRLFIKTYVQCKITDPHDKAVKNKILFARDINSEGMGLEADEAILLGTEIEAIFKLPRLSRTVKAMLKVVRIEVAGAKFFIAATMTSIADEDRNEIRKIIECFDINSLLSLAIKKGASDLHILVDHPPVLRIKGELVTLEDMSSYSADEIPSLLFSILNRQQIRTFEEKKELDFGLQYDVDNRFRVNYHQQKGFMEAAFRLINVKVSSFADLGLPHVIEELALSKDGLIIIAGATGSGKTTTIAAMVEFINKQKKLVIIDLERPIEYVYSHGTCIIKQREVGIDTNSFSVALKSSLRQDPNVIVVGELDDIETIKTSMIAAEAGYLVIVSFHAQNTIQAIDRMANMFPPESRRAILNQLSHCLKCIITQMLIPSADGKKLALATEVLISNDAVKRTLRNDDLVQIASILQTGASHNMHSMVDSVRVLVDNCAIDADTAARYSEEYSKRLR